MTPAAPGEDDHYPFKVVRLPSLLQQAHLVREHDVMWQHCVSMRMAGLFTSRSPRIFAHHVPPQKYAGFTAFEPSGGPEALATSRVEGQLNL